MNDEKKKIDLLCQLSETFGPSTAEDLVIQRIESTLNSRYQFIITPHKNLIAYTERRSFRKTIVFQAHTDELGVRPSRYHPNGFIELTPMGGIPASATNQKIVFHPGGVGGILITKQEGKRVRFYADIGAKDDAEALKMVPRYATGAYDGVKLEASPTQLMGKSLDDRAGCAAIVWMLKHLPENIPNRVVGVFTSREETGNWPVAELYRALTQKNISPDLIVNVECCPGGPVPDNMDLSATIGEGIVLVNMDASYEPDAGICKFMEEVAAESGIAYQHMAIRDGSGELGRLALGFGVPGYPLTIPNRYMHHPRSVISKNDFLACIDMLREISLRF